MMRKLAWAICLLVAAGPLIAAEAPSKPKTRTLQELIELVMKEGRERKIDPNTAGGLGFTEVELSAKAVRYASSKTPDRREHVFNVVYEITGPASLNPTALILTITKSTRTIEGKFLEGPDYRVSLDGKLLNARTVSGKVGELEQNILSTRSSSVKKDFKREMDFWLKDSISLKMDTGTRK